MEYYEKLKKVSKNLYLFALTIITFGMSVPVFASQTAVYPWAQTLSKIQDSISGPVAYAIAGIAVVGCGFAMAFMDLQGGAKKFVQVALGLSVAFGAATIITSLLPNFTGAVV